MAPSIDQQIQILARRAERILSEEDLRRKLASGRQLRIKIGLDPTAPDVTLGHCVPLSVIRQFQEWGHKAVVIIGDYTARVGDPSGRNELRPMLSGETIDANAKTYVEQIGKVLLTDPEHFEIRYNGQWLAKMNLVDIIKLASRMTLAQVMQRDDFAKRFNETTEIRLHELLYPLLQGWDSVNIDADVELGGSDQLFNNLVGREFQKEEGKEPQVVIVTPLLIGTDGAKKMSKSMGNYIAVNDQPSGDNGMFGKVMRLPDNLMEQYYLLLTDIPEADFKPAIFANPRDAKVRLAKHLLSWLYSNEAADKAEQDFMRATHGGVPEQMPELKIGPGPHKLAPVMVRAGFVSSNAEGIRKINECAVKLDGEKVIDAAKEYAFDKPVVLQLGSRKFVRLIT
jgi:tyrosyl-tRNA synthetase